MNHEALPNYQTLGSSLGTAGGAFKYSDGQVSELLPTNSRDTFVVLLARFHEVNAKSTLRGLRWRPDVLVSTIKLEDVEPAKRLLKDLSPGHVGA